MYTDCIAAQFYTASGDISMRWPWEIWNYGRQIALVQHRPTNDDKIFMRLSACDVPKKRFLLSPAQPVCR